MARERNETAPVSGVKQPKRVKLKRRKAKYGVMKIGGSAKAARPNKSGMIIGKVEERAASGGVIGLWHVRTRDATGKPITREVPVRKFKALPSSGIIKWIPYGEVTPLLRCDTNVLDSLDAFTAEEIFSLVVPRRTLARREARKELLTIEETDKAIRLARIADLAERVFGSVEKAGRWLRKEKRALGGETPLVFLSTETGARIVEEMLNRIDSGILP